MEVAHNSTMNLYGESSLVFLSTAIKVYKAYYAFRNVKLLLILYANIFACFRQKWNQSTQPQECHLLIGLHLLVRKLINQEKAKHLHWQGSLGIRLMKALQGKIKLIFME